MKTIILGVAITCLLLILTAVGLVAWLRSDTSKMEQALEWALSEILDRELQIGELLEAELDWNTYLAARDIRLANPGWADRPDFAAAGKLVIEVNLPSLWREGPVLVKRLIVEDLTLNLLAPAGQAPTWQFWPAQDEAEAEVGEHGFPVIIEEGRIARGRIFYRDPDQDFVATLDALELFELSDSDLLTLDLTGNINDIPLLVAGQVGPTSALLDGLKLEMDLQINWGDLQGSGRGRIENVAALSGVDLHVDISAPSSRPLLDLLGMPEVRDGPLHVAGDITDARPGLAMDVTGKMDEFDLRLSGSITQPTALDGVELAFELDGPSLAEAGAVFDLQGLPEIPYEASGAVYRKGSLLGLRAGKFSAGPGRMTVEGHLPGFPEIDGWQLSLDGHSVNLALVAPLIGVQGVPFQPYDISGSLASNEEGLELLDLQLISDAASLVLNGIVGEGPDYLGTRLNLVLSGQDMSQTAPWIGFRNLPSQSFVVSAAVDLIEEGWRLREGVLTSPSLEINLSGVMDKRIDTTRLDAQVRILSPNLQQTLRAYELELKDVPAVDLEFMGHLRGSLDHLELDDATFRSGNSAGSLSGTLNNPAQLDELDLSLEWEGPSLEDTLGPWLPLNLPDLPFTLRLDAGYGSSQLKISQLRATMGTNTLTGELEMSELRANPSTRGRFRLAGASSRELQALFGLEAELADNPYQITSDISATAQKIKLDSIQLKVGRSDVGGNVVIEAGEIPVIDADLHSRFLYVPFLLPDLEELEQEQQAREEAGETLDRADLVDELTPEERKERLIPDIPLDFGLMRELEGSLRYEADKIYLRKDASAAAKLDLVLSDGVLESRQLEWEGSFAAGKAHVYIDNSGDRPEMEFFLRGRRLPILWVLGGEPDSQYESLYRAQLTGTGSSPRELAASLNGAVVFVGGGGRMNNQKMDLVIGDLMVAIFDQLYWGSETAAYTEVVCGAGALLVSDGRVEAIPGFILRTEKMDLVSVGTIDLGSEALNMAFATRSRKGVGISAGKAVTPSVKLGGTLANPRLTLDAGGAALSGGAAVTTAGLSILAHGLWDRWVASAGDPCKRLIDKARKDKKRDYKALLAQ